jgi:hypothetical protein
MHQNRLNTLKDFIGFCRAELNIQTLPKISLLNDKSFVEQNRSFGEYNPQTNAIKVVALNRNLADICRSLAHELCHHRQNELNMIYNEAGDTGTDIENDANAMAGILMRDFGKRNVDVYELDTNTPLKESKRDIKFVQPKFDEEWGEAERYPDLFPDKETWYKAARLGQVQDIDCSMNIQNTDMCDGDLDDLAPEKVARAKQILNTGIVELPIVLKLGKTYELLGGNTRLTALATYGLPTKAWVIDMSKLNEIGEGTRTYSWRFDDEDADGNYFYSFDTEKSTYTVGVANLEDGMYDLSFNTTSPDGDPDVSLDTNEGVPLRVLSTVVDIAKDFIQRAKPESVIFRPIKTKEADKQDDMRRYKLYGAYIRKNIPSDYNVIDFGETYRIVKK